MVAGLPARCGAVALAGAMALAAHAQQSPSGPPADSLVQNPQRGATPQVLPPSPALPAPTPGPVPVLSTPGTPPLPAPVIVQAPARLAPAIDPLDSTGPLYAQRDGGLPAPGGDPMAIDPARDPVLALARASSPVATFNRAIGEAVARNPALDEAVAQADEAEAVRNEARTRQYPVIDLSLTHFETLSRAFSNDPLNILERSRPRFRTDASLRAQQPLFDFGSTGNRIRASGQRMEAAIAGIEDSSAQIALRAIGAWYQVYGYRALVRLGEAFVASQGDLRARVQDRVRRGAAAAGDVAQVDSYVASSAAQVAIFRRQLASAEAQYLQVVGSPAPADLGRAPVPDLSGVGADRLAGLAGELPAVRAAKFAARASDYDAKAIRADALPTVSLGVDSGRYGLLQNPYDYDIRGNVTLNLRLFGGIQQRIDQADARRRGANARLQRTQQEALRDAQIALSDVSALEEAQGALEENYLASRRSRDVLAERFRVSRGTLFDLIGAEANYFGVAARYVQTVTELDTARYILLARTGRLLGAVGVDPARLDQNK